MKEQASNKEIAIKVENLSKTFRIPHEKITSMKSAFVGAFRKKTFEEFKALDDVSFEVKKGEFFGIIGRNGSGKSTLLKILAGIYRQDGGKVEVNGLISPFLELGIGFNPELSGRDNIYLNATVLGLSKKQIDKKFDEIVAFSELERFIDQKLKNYSSGMSVRLAFSVAIHAHRDILLMDEVLAVGDMNFQQKCIDEFQKYKERNKIIVLVTHNIETARRYCDRLLLLRDGKIIKIGDPDEVIEKYIYQNMSDEERRISDQEIEVASEEKIIIDEKKENTDSKTEQVNKFKKEDVVKNEEVKPTKIAEIKKIKIIDKKEKKRNIFRNGDVIRIVVSAIFYKKIKNPLFGIIINSENGNKVFATNTLFKNVNLGTVKEKSKIEVTFKIKNYFASGKYYITLAVAGNSGRIFYDWINNAVSFQIMNNYNSGGVVDFEHEILFNINNK